MLSAVPFMTFLKASAKVFSLLPYLPSGAVFDYASSVSFTVAFSMGVYTPLYRDEELHC